jgi:hypothetical protein
MSNFAKIVTDVKNCVRINVTLKQIYVYYIIKIKLVLHIEYLMMSKLIELCKKFKIMS